MESDISATRRSEYRSRRLLVAFSSLFSLIILLPVSLRDQTASSTPSLLETEQNISVHYALAVPFLPFYIGEKSAVKRILNKENQVSKETDGLYDAAEKDILSDLTEKIQRSIEEEVKSRVQSSIQKSAVESIERNLAAALDDKDANKKILSRIKSLDNRIQEFQNEVEAEVRYYCKE